MSSNSFRANAICHFGFWDHELILTSWKEVPEGKVGKDMGNTSRRPELRGGDEGGDIWQVEVLEVS